MRQKDNLCMYVCTYKHCIREHRKRRDCGGVTTFCVTNTNHDLEKTELRKQYNGNIERQRIENEIKTSKPHSARITTNIPKKKNISNTTTTTKSAHLKIQLIRKRHKKKTIKKKN